MVITDPGGIEPVGKRSAFIEDLKRNRLIAELNRGFPNDVASY